MKDLRNTHAALVFKARVAWAGKVLSGIATGISFFLALGFGGNGDALATQMAHATDSTEVASLMAEVSRSDSMMLMFTVAGALALLVCVICVRYEKHLWSEFHSMRMFARVQIEARRENVPIITLQ